jgi:fructokinase
MQVERWVGISSAVKVSDDDLKWLYPSLEIDQVVSNWLRKGPSLIVVTYGDKGLAGYREGEKVRVDTVKVAVADTVGAGDTVGAILVEAIVKDELNTLSGVRLEMMLKRAAKAAAITVSRSGANPPTLKAITKSYRNLSRKWHPDKNKAKGAREKFVVSTISLSRLLLWPP